jgi:multiple sugar transport system ATP-binding protein
VAGIWLDGVQKTYPDGTEAVESVDLHVPDGSLVVLVGPSGCGKTTILLMVAGLEETTGGTIRIGDRIVNDVPPMDRDIAMVFQNYALYPHMTVYRNMAFGLRMRKVDRVEIDRRVREAARILDLSDELLAKKPKQLSGGQRQRVAMGRAIVRQPSAFLMDEPLSNLDAALRVEMRGEISRIQRDLGVTTIYVTHDQTEAMTLGDLVVCLSDGVLQQVGTPQDLYDHPANLFVGGFMGSPAMNLAEADLVRSDDASLFVEFAGYRLRIAESVAARPAIASRNGGKVIVGIRPEDMEDASIARHGASPDLKLPVEVELRESVGPEAYVHFTLDAAIPRTRGVAEARAGRTNGEADFRENKFVARISSRTRSQRGDRIELIVDTTALHFFDPETGVSL